MSKRKDAIDPAVAGLLDEAERREKDRQRTAEERAKAKRDAERTRATYDLPSQLQEVISQIAELEGLSKSSTAALLLAQGAHKRLTGEIDFTGAKTSTNHPLYNWVVESNTIVEILKGDRTLDT